MAASCIQFGRHLECPVCTETYSPQEHVPKVLPCGHTFCNICLEKEASDPCGHTFCNICLEKVASYKSVECPKCEASHKVPRQGVQGFITNHDILDLVDCSCEKCLRYDQTSRCTHCNGMLCSPCRESHTGDLHASVIAAITGLQQMSSSLSAEWSEADNKISAVISQCDIFCSKSKRNLSNPSSFDSVESTRDHTSLCVKIGEIQTIIRQLPSDITDIDLTGLSITSASAPVVLSAAPPAEPARDQTQPRLVCGSKGSGPGELYSPQSVAVDPDTGDIHVADWYNHRVDMYSATGTPIQSYGSKARGDQGLIFPSGVAIDRHGNRIVTDEHTVSIYSRDGKLEKRFGKRGDGRGEFKYPQGVVADNAGLLYIAERNNRRVQVCNMAGDCVRMIGEGDPGRLQWPIGVAIDGDGDVYVTDNKAKQVNIYTASGQYKSSITAADVPQQGWWPRYIAVDGDRQLYVTDVMNHCVHVLKDGRHIQQIGSEGDREGCFSWPTGIALSRDGGLIVCDQNNHRIQVYGQQ